MVNPFREVNWQPDLKERRRFGASLIFGFPCVAAALLVAVWRRGAGWSFGFPLAVGGIGLVVGLILWAAPQIARPFYVGWYVVACCAGFLTGNALLAAVYVFLFAPVGLARRAMGRSALSRRFDRSSPTYWRDAEMPDDAARYYRQF